MADPRGFITTPRQVAPRRPVEERVNDWNEVYPGGPGKALLPIITEQAGRCMDCGIPFCHQGCPLGNLIPEWNDLVWRDDWIEAIDRLHATNNFPEFTGRLCPAPCETVAQQLTRAGHTVAVYERDDKAGGLLRYGIPEFKMEKVHVDRRVEQMQREGTVFRTGVQVGDTLTGSQLRDRYDAVVLAIGSTVRRDLPAPGRELAGIHQAMEFLPQANRVAVGEEVQDQILATDKDVVIIGGGDTGADCLGTSIRQGARSVTSLEIMPQPGDDRPETQPWPTYPMVYRVASAHEEGGERKYAVSTKEFVGDDDGNVAGLRIVEVEMKDGRFEEVPGSEKVIPAQLVLFAMGFTGPQREGLVEQLGVDLDERGNIVRDRDFMSSVPGVFVAGDAGRGQSLIVWAIAEGRSAAAGVDAYLTGGRSPLPRPIKPNDRPLMV